MAEHNVVPGTAIGTRGFNSTVWSVVLGAQASDTEIARNYLNLLVQRYWRPVYYFIRHQGKSHEDAQDLTQGFFTLFLEKDLVSYADQIRGRFRSFLLASVRRYLALAHRIDSRKPTELTLSGIDAISLEASFVPDGSVPPDIAYLQNWAKCLIENCIIRLRQECTIANRDIQFKVFESRFLDPDGPIRGNRPNYRTLGAQLGISQSSVRNNLHRARRRFARILRNEIANAAMEPEDVEDELNELLACLSGE